MDCSSGNRAGRACDDAIALSNEHDDAAARTAFRKLAAASPDPDIAKAAGEKANELSRVVSKVPLSLYP